MRGGRSEHGGGGSRPSGADEPRLLTPSMLTPSGSAVERTRLVRLPRTRPLAEPISHAQMGFFGSGGFYLRVSLLGAVALAVFGVLALRLWSLQVLQGPSYSRAARQQTFRFVDLATPRGPILDARGRVVAGTAGRLVVSADADALGGLDAHGRWHPHRQGLHALAALAAVTSVRPGTLVARIRASVGKNPHAPAVVVRRLSRRLSFYLGERAARFPGLSVQVVPERSYPQRALGSEFLGLLGEVSPRQLVRRRHRGERAGEVIGQSGVEATYDPLLNVGFQRARVAVDSLGRTAGRLSMLALRSPGRGLQLTIDMRVQRAAVHAIQHGIALAHRAGHHDARAGAAVVLDARNGGVLALASHPTFDQVAAARDPEYLAGLLKAGPDVPRC